MPLTHTSPPSRLRLMGTALVALAIAVAAVVVPTVPAAANTGRITGTAVVPDEAVAVWGENIRFDVTIGTYAAGSDALLSYDSPNNGRFTVDDVPTGTTVNFRITSASQLWGGWVSQNGTLVQSRGEAGAFRAGDTGLDLKLAVPFFRGAVELPAGYDTSRVGRLRVRTYEYDAAKGAWQYRAQSPVSPSGAFLARWSDALMRVDLFDSDDILRNGYYGGPGPLVPHVDAVAVRASDVVVLRPALYATITGRVLPPSGRSLTAGAARVQAHTAGSGGYWPKGTESTIAADGSFELRGLDAGASYVLVVKAADGSGFGGGTRTADGGLAAQYPGGAVLTAPATGVDVRLRPDVAVSGSVTFPRGFSYDRTTPPTVTGRYESVSISGRSETTLVGPVAVAADGTFRLPGTHPDTPVVLALTWPGGATVYWTGDTTQPSTDLASAERVAAPATVRFPHGFATAGTPTITGDARTGGLLTAAPGSWTPTPTTLSYVWLRDGAAVPGATGRTYRVQAADVGRTLAVRVTAARTGTVDARATSAGVVVSAGVLRSTGRPTISGRAVAGAQLQASAGSWSDTPDSVSYQWRRDGAAIAGATSATYRVTASDRRADLSVTVTARRTGFSTASATSATVTVAAGTMAPTKKPALSSTKARAGVLLRVSRGSWPVPVKVAYQWLRNGKAISGATSSSYRPGKADVGARLSARVTATASGYDPVRVTTPRTGKVAAYVPTVSVKAPRTAKTTTRTKVTVTVKATRLTKRPTGTVRVTAGKTTVKVALTARHKGTVSVRLPRLARGSYTVTATYTPSKALSKHLSKKTSAKRTLTVR